MINEIYINFKDTENSLHRINTTDAVEFSKWTKEKANLRYKGQLPKFPIYNNFIYWCNLGINVGSEQNKLRPVLVLKSSRNSPICAILPLTSKRINDQFLFHMKVKK